MTLAYDYVIANEGLDVAYAYPFQGKVIDYALMIIFIYLMVDCSNKAVCTVATILV